tara:strand:+ start:2016 stop:2423 length:408 start_codon:yes stop_codon:yes gene_type:complete
MVTFQFVPFHEIRDLDSQARVQKLFNIVKNQKIVVMEGRLHKEEETALIEYTMGQVSRSFPGIELGVIYPDRSKMDGMEKFKESMLKFFIGDRQGFTVIGPASVVKRIVRNPGKLELFTTDNGGAKKKAVRRKKK